MRRTSRVAQWSSVLLATVLGALVASVLTAGAQESDASDPELVVRSVDGSDPDAVRVEFLWTGNRNQVPDLVVRENGTVVEHTLPFALGDQEEFGIVLAIDTSESMTENAAFERAQDAAKEFIANKAASDQIAVVGFSDVVQVMTGFTADQDELVAAVDELGVGGSTAIFDAIRRSVNLFEGTDLVPNVIVVTDGRDEASDATEAVAASLLDESNALLYAIGIESGDLNEAVLDRLTGTTGGELLTSADPQDLSALYADVQGRIRQQFSTTFVSEASREGPSDLALTIGATTGQASYTPGARLDSVQLVEPVPVADNPGIEFLQGDVFLWLGVALALLAVAGAVYAIGTSLVRDGRRLDRVLQPYSDGFVASDEEHDDRLATTAILQRAVELTGEFAQRRGILQRIEDLLERANLPLRAAEALFFYVVAVLLLTLLGAAVAGDLVAGLLVFVVAALVPIGVVLYMGQRRHAQFQDQLPDLLGLMASTLRAGYSLMQGVEAAAREVQEPTRRELQRVVTEARLGMPLEEALFNVSVRMKSRDFEWAVMAISIQREVGGNLAELLDIVGETMRARTRLRRDISALTAEGRVSAVVLGVLPIAVGAIIYSMNPEYMEQLFDRGLGVAMVIASGGLMLLGFYWMYKIIDIDV